MAKRYVFKSLVDEREDVSKILKESSAKLKEFGFDKDEEKEVINTEMPKGKAMFRLLYQFAKSQGISGSRAQILASEILDIFYEMVERGKFSSSDDRTFARGFQKIKQNMHMQ